MTKRILPLERALARFRVGTLALGLVFATACGTPQPMVPGVQPDAGEAPSLPEASPHRLALERMLEGRWLRQADRDNQLQVPLLDARHWKRVRFSLIDSFVGFRVGKSPDALAVVLLQPRVEGEPNGSRDCMRRAEQAASPVLQAFDVRLGEMTQRTIDWRHQSVTVHETSGAVDYGFGPRYFAVAWAAYPAYTDGCLVFGLAIPWEGERELAEQVRERWVTEGLRRMKPLTELMPHRK